MSVEALPGEAFPLGATPRHHGTNFAVTSGADGVLLCLFGAGDTVTVPVPFASCEAVRTTLRVDGRGDPHRSTPQMRFTDRSPTTGSNDSR
jgi:hypothetical protein